MKTYLPLVAWITSSLLSLSGCMAMGMQGMERGTVHQDQHANKAICAETRLGDVTISLEVPPLTVAVESTLSVRVIHTSSGQPVSGAKIAIAISQLTPPSGHHPAILFEGRAEEGTARGVYAVQHTFAEQGPHDIVASVWGDGVAGPAAPMTVAATQEVYQRTDSKGRMMDAMPMGMLYGTGMAVMMALMMGGRFLF